MWFIRTGGELMNTYGWTLFTFKGHFEHDDYFQERYVLARTEEEAVRKMRQYVADLLNQGYARFLFSEEPTVDTENVIC